MQQSRSSTASVADGAVLLIIWDLRLVTCIGFDNLFRRGGELGRSPAPTAVVPNVCWYELLVIRFRISEERQT